MIISNNFILFKIIIISSEDSDFYINFFYIWVYKNKLILPVWAVICSWFHLTINAPFGWILNCKWVLLIYLCERFFFWKWSNFYSEDFFTVGNHECPLQNCYFFKPIVLLRQERHIHILKSTYIDFLHDIGSHWLTFWNN